ncbi:MAG TPA: calcium-binding protein [Kofleriaceae bacterium]|nr:calcium-binding protein [Kofleriaceae bacterium]
MRLVLSAIGLAMMTACVVGDETPLDEAIDDALAAGQDPCQAPGIRARANVPRVDGRYVGGPGADVILGTAGKDVIFGGDGDDLICAFGGDDVIDGGDGRDRIYAGAGDDIIHGRGGSDTIWAGPGADLVFGDLLDDELHGEEGNDILIGGHGTDLLDGGPGNDTLRGDTGNDEFRGGDGIDLASFTTAMPPGQPENTTTGIHVRGDSVDGDGGNEPLEGIERLAGSMFTDDVRGTITPAHALGQVFTDVQLGPGGDPVDVGVIVLGTAGDDDVEIHHGDNVVVVTANHPLAAGPGCSAAGGTVRCAVGGNFHYVVGWGDDGADTFRLTGDWPRDFEAHVSGGEGSDHLIGGDEQDVFFTGASGTDYLEGRGGDDALISESHHDASWDGGDRPKAGDYHDGADILDGGAGNDQLVVDYVCGGHRYLGGPGRDIAGFARSGRHAIYAQLGGPTTYHSNWWGAAANPDLCRSKQDWTTFRTGADADLEILEASDGADYLWGDDRDDVLWGRAGGDHVYGLGGDDELLGADGRDVLVGGGGVDEISYGKQP